MITPIALVVGAVWLFMGYSMPAYTALSGYRATVASYEDTLAQANQLNDLKNSLLDTYKSLPPEGVSRLQKLLPNDFDPTHFIVAVNNLAASNGVALKTIKVSTPSAEAVTRGGTPQGGSQGSFIPAGVANQSSSAKQAATPYSSLTVVLSVSGAYPSLGAFMTDLEQSLELIDITNITVKPVSANAVEEEITFKTYYYSN